MLQRCLALDLPIEKGTSVLVFSALIVLISICSGLPKTGQPNECLRRLWGLPHFKHDDFSILPGGKRNRRLRHSSIILVFESSSPTGSPELYYAIFDGQIEGYALLKYGRDLNKEGEKRPNGAMNRHGTGKVTLSVIQFNDTAIWNLPRRLAIILYWI